MSVFSVLSLLSLACGCSAFQSPAANFKLKARSSEINMKGKIGPTDLSKEFGWDVETGGPWDPVNFASANQYDFERFRSVELKHGRICMLATLGFIVQEFFQWPAQNGADWFTQTFPLDALDKVPGLGKLQILLVIGAIEAATGPRDGSYGIRTPGDIGFDPLGLSKDGIDPKFAMAELKNGRLAMLAFSAFVTQCAITGKPIIAGTFNF